MVGANRVIPCMKTTFREMLLDMPSEIPTRYRRAALCGGDSRARGRKQNPHTGMEGRGAGRHSLVGAPPGPPNRCCQGISRVEWNHPSHGPPSATEDQWRQRAWRPARSPAGREHGSHCYRRQRRGRAGPESAAGSEQPDPAAQFAAHNEATDQTEPEGAGGAGGKPPRRRQAGPTTERRASSGRFRPHGRGRHFTPPPAPGPPARLTCAGRALRQPPATARPTRPHGAQRRRRRGSEPPPGHQTQRERVGGRRQGQADRGRRQESMGTGSGAARYRSRRRHRRNFTWVRPH